MKFLLILVSLIYSIAVIEAKKKVKSEEGVLVLTDDNFEDIISEHDIIMVEFYAPWCGHCKKLAPEYAAAAKVLSNLDTPIPLAKIDATANPDTTRDYDIKGYPSLKVFEKGHVSNYEGERSQDDIVKYMKKLSGQGGPILHEISEEEVSDFKERGEVVIIGRFSSSKSPQYKQFYSLANDMDDIPFGVIIKEGSENRVELYKSFADEEEEVIKFNGSLTKSDLTTFIYKNRLPLIVPFNSLNSKILFSEKQPIRLQYILLANADDEYSLKLFRKAAPSFKGKVWFIHANEENEDILKHFGYSVSDFPVTVLVNMPVGGSMKTYKPTSSKQSHKGFLKNYFSGNIKPFLKSEDKPSSQNEPVYVLVGKEFKNVALDDSKDVLVEFYAPWCGHCKSLAPKYESLAKSLQGVESLIIAKMDATANEVDHPEVEVTGYPTIKFFPANSNGKVVAYNGPLEGKDILDFVHSNAGIKFKKPKLKDEL